MEDAAGTGDVQALIDAGRFEDAIVALRPLLEQEPVDGNVLFLYGLASLEASQRPGRTDEDREVLLNEAVAAFHAMLVEAPGLVRVRLELARAFFLKDSSAKSARRDIWGGFRHCAVLMEAVVPLSLGEAQFVNRRHYGRLTLDSLWESDRWITSGFGTGSRVSMS